MKLLTPGPVEVPEPVLLAMSQKMISHRGPEFRKLLENVTEKLVRLANADEAHVLAGSGTTAVDAMTWSLVPRGARVLALVWGEFGERFASSARLRGALVDEKRYSWGSAPDPEEISELLENHSYDYVLLVHNETSTGLAYRDIERVAKAAARTGTRLLIDSVSGFPVERISLTNGVYAVATASHKALAAPPGAAIILLNREAVEELEKRGKTSNDTPPVLDLARYHWFLRNRSETPFTPAIPIIRSLLKALELVEEKGIEKIREEHRDRATRLYREPSKYGYKPLVEKEQYRSNTVVALQLPSHLDSVRIKDRLAREGYIIATGMGKLKKRTIRIGVMGNISQHDIERVIRVLEEVASTKALED